MAKTKKFVVRDLARKELRLRTYALDDGAKPEVVTEEIKVVEPSYKFEDGILISDVRVCDLITVKSCIYKIPEDESTAEVELIRENARGKTTFRLPLSVVGDTRKLGEVLANHHILLKQSNQYVMSDYFRHYEQARRFARFHPCAGKSVHLKRLSARSEGRNAVKEMFGHAYRVRFSH